MATGRTVSKSFSSKLETAGRTFLKGGVQTLRAAIEAEVREAIPGAFIRELRNEWGDIDVGLRRRLELLHHGFLPRAELLYDFDTYDYGDYMTNYQRWQKTPRINTYPHEIIDKLNFHQTMAELGYEELRPEVFGLVENGLFYPDRESKPTGSASEQITNFLESEGCVVIKPTRSGGGGEGVTVCELNDEIISVNGSETSMMDFERWLNSLDENIVERLVEQGAYGNSLYPKSANTIRLATLVDEDGPYVIEQVQRIGTDASAPVDNVSSGGLSVVITDGVLGECFRFLDGEFELLESHPDTGAQITGRPVDDWDDIREKVLELAESIPDNPYIAWDILPTDDGLKILEANAHFDIEGQVHGPFLIDDRVRRFYEVHGVI